MAAQDDAVSKHGFTALGDVDPVPRAYRDRDGRNYAAPGHIERFDPAVEQASPELQPSPGTALLDLFVCTDPRAAGTGVVLLDGAAVASGDGRHQWEIAPGRHRLEVQGADASTTEFEAAEGERVCFTTGQGAAVRHQMDFRTELYRVTGADGFMPVLSTRAAHASAAGCLLSLGGLPLVIGAGIGASLSSGALQAVWAALAFLGLAALVTGFTMGTVTTGRLHKRAKASRLDSHRTAPGGAVAFPSPKDAEAWSKDRSVRGVLLVLDLFLYRLTRDPDGTAAYAGAGDHLALAHAGGVRVWIDGAEAPADWASWHYPLAAGPHHVVVEYGVEEYGTAEARHEFDIDVKDVDDLTVVHVPVQVFRLWDTGLGAPAALPPRIAHSVQRRAKSALAKLNRNDSAREEWVPTRYWTARTPQA